MQLFSNQFQVGMEKLTPSAMAQARFMAPITRQYLKRAGGAAGDAYHVF